MINQIVVLQRLFNHRQIEFIDFAEHIDVSQAVATVTVDMKCLIGKLFPNRQQHVVVPARTKLQFDSHKPIVNRLPNC